jgi:hypothetical protein
MFRRRHAWVVVAACVTAPAGAWGAGSGPSTPPAIAAPAVPSPAIQAPAVPTEVNGPEISILIRTAIVALHQANVTGNYTVLRDLGASVMQAGNSAADLAAQFADFRKNGLNLAPTVLYDPILDEKPQLSANGALRLIGHFPTKPHEVVFDLTFIYEVGAWRIAQMQVGIRAASGDADASAATPPSPGATLPASPAGASDAPAAEAIPLPRLRP